MRNSRGFTLLELMVVVVILAIISVIAVPSYFSYLQGSRRAEAYSALLALSQVQERFYINNNTYTNNVATLTGLIQDANLVGSVNYAYDIPTANTTTFTVRETAQAAQTGDTGCTVLTLTAAGVRAPVACW